LSLKSAKLREQYARNLYRNLTYPELLLSSH